MYIWNNDSKNRIGDGRRHFILDLASVARVTGEICSISFKRNYSIFQRQTRTLMGAMLMLSTVLFSSFGGIKSIR